MIRSGALARLASLVFVLLLVTPGCGGSGGGADGATPDGSVSPDGAVAPDTALGSSDGAPATSDGAATSDGSVDVPVAACPATGMGTLAITVEGLPSDVTPLVTVIGPSGAVPFVASAMVPAGTYAVSASRVTSVDPIARRAFIPSVMSSPTCVMNALMATVRVVYSEIATSNKLWMGNANSPAQLLGFASSTIRMTSLPQATVEVMAKGSNNLAFDKDGNLWLGGGTVQDPPILRIPATMLRGPGAKTADIAIDSAVFGGGSPRSTSLAFDKEGNLWSTVGWKGDVVRFTAAQLLASGKPVPAVTLSGLKGPRGLAFDKSGNLWLGNADEKQVVRYDATRLGASTAAAPDLVIVASTPPPVIGTLSSPNSLAFDKTGNLWVSYDGKIVMLPAADLAGTGNKALTPEIQIDVSVTALPEQVAFDESGGLWFAGSQGNFARLGPEQLTSGGNKVPSIVISSTSVMSAGDFAIFPAPAGLPLYHSWP